MQNDRTQYEATLLQLRTAAQSFRDAARAAQAEGTKLDPTLPDSPLVTAIATDVREALAEAAASSAGMRMAMIVAAGGVILGKRPEGAPTLADTIAAAPIAEKGN